jgi:ATP-dependent RNA helicase DDX19/DBP5
LAVQTGEVASLMSRFAPELTIRYVVRGEEIPRGSQLTDHIIIGTPGKVTITLLKNSFFD